MGKGGPIDAHMIAAQSGGTYRRRMGTGIVVCEISDDAQAEGKGRAPLASAPSNAERAASADAPSSPTCRTRCDREGSLSACSHAGRNVSERMLASLHPIRGQFRYQSHK
jgi:hypothetical protein